MTETRILSVESVGSNTVAITLETPSDFDAFPGQFVLIRATIDGSEETGHYTLSSPTVEDSFEITVKVDPEGTLGTWLANRRRNNRIEFDGPFGSTTYDGADDVIILASGPGIGPAIGIGERARASSAAATLLYDSNNPAHTDRLKSLRADGAEIRTGVTALEEQLRTVDDTTDIYVFGFETFVEEAVNAVSTAGLDPGRAHVENFGPK